MLSDLSLAIAAQLLTLASARYSKFTISPFVSLHCTGLQSGKDFAIKEGKCHDVDIESFYMSIYKHKGRGKWQNPDQNCTLVAYNSRGCVEGSQKPTLYMDIANRMGETCNDPLPERSARSLLFSCKPRDCAHQQ